MPRLLTYLFACLLLLTASLTGRAADTERRERFEATWQATLPDDSPGYGVALGEENVAIADRVEPNAPGTLALGFDTLNPPTKNPFNADGNVYDRPQREVSIHWNGTEVANRLCPVELKGAKGHRVRWRVAFVPGGAEVSVRVDETDVYDRFFVAGALPGALKGEKFSAGGAATVTGVRSGWSGRTAKPASPVRVRAFDKVLNDKGHHRQESRVAFPEKTDGVGRVVCTLTLEATPNGIDPWDRLAHVYLYDEKGERFDILRYITPYRKGWTWRVDVTDLLPLLQGTKRMEVFCETYAAGWLVSVDFDFYPGKLERVPYRVDKLWSATATLGQADKPVEKALPPLTVTRPTGAKKAAVRLVVTGHGMSPNTDNAAEFLPLWRKLLVGEKQVYENNLWKTDCYLNPCRPQGGTWKFDRAGWAPGDVVAPWVVDVTRHLPAGKPTTLRYKVQPYVNKTPEPGNPARHVVEGVVIYYR
ncbi:MAG TPA: peptide-N-glycosidase F-related protein [Armatimonadaceae bacterium]|nr:peptide-N-glycosidase F-related protein [Armatimonadaceae bacterium]